MKTSETLLAILELLKEEGMPATLSSGDPAISISVGYGSQCYYIRENGDKLELMFPERYGQRSSFRPPYNNFGPLIYSLADPNVVQDIARCIRNDPPF